MKQIKPVLSTLAAASLLAVSASASAGYFTSTITSGFNLYEDQSREAYVDVNGDGLFSVGDVLVGFARLDDRTSPPPQDLNNTTYAIFTQQVYKIEGNTVFWEPTKTAGLTISDLTGVGGANDLAVVFSSGAGGYGLNLIDTSPGDVTGVGGVTLADYFAYILTNGTLDMVIGMTGTTDTFCTGIAGSVGNCFQASSGFAGASNALFAELDAGVTVANFIAGLTVTQDPAGVQITENTLAGSFYTGPVVLTAELAFSNGAAQGSVGSTNQAEWVNASELTSLNQCTVDGVNVPCGFINDVDFVFRAQVPEPATLALVGLGLLGVAGMRRRRT
jgi:hypothetical protein